MTDILKANLTWAAFSKLLDKFPDRAREDIMANYFIFDDGKVIFRGPLRALDQQRPDLTLH